MSFTPKGDSGASAKIVAMDILVSEWQAMVMVCMDTAHPVRRSRKPDNHVAVAAVDGSLNYPVGVLLAVILWSVTLTLPEGDVLRSRCW